MNKKIVLFLLLLTAITGVCFAQSAEKVEEIINAGVVTKGQACYLVGTAVGSVEDSVSYSDAFSKYAHLKMFKDASFDEPITLAEFSNLVLQNSKANKSLWYMLSKSPYYALRQLKLDGIISKNAVGSADIKPLAAFNILSKLIADEVPEGEE